MRTRALTLLGALALLTPVLAAVATAGDTDPVFRAGAARAEITPPVTTPMFAYTARHAGLATGDDLSGGEYPRFLDQRDDHLDTELYGKTFMESEGVHTRLYANAYVLDDGDRMLALVLTDLGGLPGELHQAVADRLAAMDVPISREDLLIGATHTHGGPGAIFQYQGYALLGGDEFDPRVFGLVADQTAKAVADAYANLEPATLAIGSVEVPGASRQRSTAAHVLNPGHAADDHVDPEATVIRIDAADGRPMGVITTFAAHGTIVGDRDLLFTGDNQGIATRLVAQGIAAASGQDEHDVVVTYLNGAQGDISPIGSGSDFFESVADAGARQAPPILDAWAALGDDLSADVDLDARFKFVCFCGQEVENGERISAVPVLGMSVVAGDGTTTPVELVPGHGSKAPALLGPGLVPQIVRVQAMRINDHVMVTMPGEASTALGEQIEADILALDPSVASVDVVGLANDYISYMSTVPEYDAQHYEGGFNLYGRMTGPLFEAELVALADAMLDGEPVPVGHAGVLEHPDTATPSTGQVALVPDAPAAAGQLSTTSAAAGELVTFDWIGGNPAVDHPVDEVMVRLVDTATGDAVTDDRGFELRIRYAKTGANEHHWSVGWIADEPGSYAFEVSGRQVTALGVGGYTLASGTFVVG